MYGQVNLVFKYLNRNVFRSHSYPANLAIKPERLSLSHMYGQPGLLTGTFVALTHVRSGQPGL